MKFSDLPKEARDRFLEVLQLDIERDLTEGTDASIKRYAASTDEFVRRNTYLILGKIYSTHFQLKDKVYFEVDRLLKDANSQVRDTAVMTFGELMKLDPRKAVGLVARLRPSDFLGLPKEVLEQLRKLGKLVVPDGRVDRL